MSDREAFEKWILQDYVEDYIRKEPLHGCYAHPLIEDYWNAWEPSWQASRAQAIDECVIILEQLHFENPHETGMASIGADKIKELKEQS